MGELSELGKFERATSNRPLSLPQQVTSPLSASFEDCATLQTVSAVTLTLGMQKFNLKLQKSRFHCAANVLSSLELHKRSRIDEVQ